jgi:hypothetical protein
MATITSGFLNKKPIISIGVSIPKECQIGMMHLSKHRLYNDVDKDINEGNFPFIRPEDSEVQLEIYKILTSTNGSEIERYCQEVKKFSKNRSCTMSTIHTVLEKYEKTFLATDIMYSTLYIPFSSLKADEEKKKKFIPKLSYFSNKWDWKSTYVDSSISVGNYIGILTRRPQSRKWYW